MKTTEKQTARYLIPLLLEYLRHPSLDGHPIRQKMRQDLKILAETPEIASVSQHIDLLEEISRDAWSGERDRMNGIGRTADQLIAIAKAAGGAR